MTYLRCSFAFWTELPGFTAFSWKYSKNLGRNIKPQIQRTEPFVNFCLHQFARQLFRKPISNI